MSETNAKRSGKGISRPLSIAMGWRIQEKRRHGFTAKNTKAIDEAKGQDGCNTKQKINMKPPKTPPRESRRKIIHLPHFLKRTPNRTAIREGEREKATDEHQVQTPFSSSPSQVRVGRSFQSEDEMSEMMDSHGPDFMPGLGLDKYSLIDEDDLTRIPLSHSRANEVGRLKSVASARRRSKATSSLAETSCSSDSDTRTNHSRSTRDGESVYLSKTSNSNYIDSVLVNAKKHGKVLVLQLQDADAVEAVSFSDGKRSNYVSYAERILEEEQEGIFDEVHDGSFEEDESQQVGISFEPYYEASTNEDGIEQSIEQQPNKDDDYDDDDTSSIVQTRTNRQYPATSSLGPVGTPHPAVVSPGVSNGDSFDDDCTGPLLPDVVDLDDSVASSAAGNNMKKLQEATTSSRRYDHKGVLQSPNLTPPRSIGLKYSEDKLNSFEIGMDSQKSRSPPRGLVSPDENDEAWGNMQKMIKKELSMNKRTPILVERFQSDFTRDQSGFSTMSDALYSRSTGSFADQTVGSYGSDLSKDFSEMDSVTTDALRMEMPMKDELKAMAKEISAKGPVVVMKWLNPTTI